MSKIIAEDSMVNKIQTMKKELNKNNKKTITDQN